MIYQVLVGFTRFYRVLLGFTGLYLVWLSFTGFYWVLLGFTGFYWVLLDLPSLICCQAIRFDTDVVCLVLPRFFWSSRTLELEVEPRPFSIPFTEFRYRVFHFFILFSCSTFDSGSKAASVGRWRKGTKKKNKKNSFSFCCRSTNPRSFSSVSMSGPSLSPFFLTIHAIPCFSFKLFLKLFLHLRWAYQLETDFYRFFFFFYSASLIWIDFETNWNCCLVFSIYFIHAKPFF